MVGRVKELCFLYQHVDPVAPGEQLAHLLVKVFAPVLPYARVFLADFFHCRDGHPPLPRGPGVGRLKVVLERVFRFVAVLGGGEVPISWLFDRPIGLFGIVRFFGASHRNEPCFEQWLHIFCRTYSGLRCRSSPSSSALHARWRRTSRTTLRTASGGQRRPSAPTRAPRSPGRSERSLCRASALSVSVFLSREWRSLDKPSRSLDKPWRWLDSAPGSLGSLNRLSVPPSLLPVGRYHVAALPRDAEEQPPSPQGRVHSRRRRPFRGASGLPHSPTSLQCVRSRPVG